MGCLNQLNFVKDHGKAIKGPILEVGSRDYGNTPDFRSLFPGCDYTGVDREAGKGVDMVLDFTDGFEKIDRALSGRRFNAIICFSVLEHCRDPFRMCDNMERLLLPEGLALISVPFSFEVHGYPSDYWRFTPEGVKALFPRLDFDRFPAFMCTEITGENMVLDDMLFRFNLPKATGRNIKGGLAGKLLLALCKRAGVSPGMFDYNFLWPRVMINMIGVNKR